MLNHKRDYLTICTVISHWFASWTVSNPETRIILNCLHEAVRGIQSRLSQIFLFYPAFLTPPYLSLVALYRQL